MKKMGRKEAAWTSTKISKKKVMIWHFKLLSAAFAITTFLRSCCSRMSYSVVEPTFDKELTPTYCSITFVIAN